MKLNKILSAALAVGAMAALAGTAEAAPVQFNITAASWTIGSGYGTGSGQLDVTFSNSFFTPQSFTLSQGGIQAFLFGTVRLNETNIDSNETNNLGVTANITFTDPLSAIVQSVAVTGAFTGSVTDAGLDYFIDFSPVVVSFGNGGQFTIDIADLHFNTTGPITTSPNITLDKEPTDRTVPEPMTAALLGAGLLGLGLARRRQAS